MPVKKRASRRRATPARVVVENVNVPRHTARVDAEKYAAMRAALMRVMPRRRPGITQRDMFRAVVPHLPERLFPAGATASWWAKTVQLDLEAKGVLAREASRPLRWHRARP